MDIGSVRPVMTGLTAPVPKAPAAAEQATTTDLPVDSTVTRSSDTDSTSGATRNGASQASQDANNVRSTVTIDKDTDSVIYRQIDKMTGDVVDQIPTESRLRQRAMIDSWMGMSRTSSSLASTVA